MKPTLAVDLSINTMKHLELYKMCKAASTHATRSVQSTGNLPRTALLLLTVLLVEPLIMYKYYRRVPFSLDYYLHQIGYFSLILIPLGIVLLWTTWRDDYRQRCSYNWIGNFKVRAKYEGLFSCFLLLSPGEENRIKINRRFYYRTRVGDSIIIKRDALGVIKEIKRTGNIKSRLARNPMLGRVEASER